MGNKGQTTVKVVTRKLAELKPYANNPRQNDNAMAAVAESIRQFGWQQPIVVDENDIILVGHTRFKAAQQLGMKTAPVIVATGLTEEEARAYRLADNRLAELAQWDFEKLGAELDKLDNFAFDAFGFDFSFMDYEEQLDDHLAEYYEEEEDEEALYPVKIEIDREYRKIVHDYKKQSSRRVEKAVLAKLGGVR